LKGRRGPVYVAGLERSGTSLMYGLLASHPQIAMTRRTNLWKHFYRRYGDLDDPGNLERCLGTMRRYKRLVILELDWSRLRSDFRDGDPTYARLFELLEEQYAQRVGRPRWGDKSLDTERHADAIFDAYPGARILHMIRDPRDRYASSYVRWKVRRGGVGAGTAEWLSSVRLAKLNESRYPDRYRSVRYETLASQPVTALRDVCAFIDAEYTPAMLAMDGAPGVRDGGNSSYGRHDPGVISTTSIGRFSDVLSPRQIAFIQFLAKDEMTSFGYELHSLRLALGERFGFALRDVPLESAHAIAWRTRETIRGRAGRPLPSYRLVDRRGAA
jgi:hypothetical protein